MNAAVLRSSAVVMMGSVSREKLVESIAKTFAAVGPARLKVATEVLPLEQVEERWKRSTGKPRVVFTIP